MLCADYVHVCVGLQLCSTSFCLCLAFLASIFLGRAAAAAAAERAPKLTLPFARRPRHLPVASLRPAFHCCPASSPVQVYNIEQRAIEPVGGAARFAAAVRRYQGEHPLVLFSGDCLNPSLMSAFTRGEQVRRVHAGVSAGVLGAAGRQRCSCPCVPGFRDRGAACSHTRGARTQAVWAGQQLLFCLEHQRALRTLCSK